LRYCSAGEFGNERTFNGKRAKVCATTRSALLALLHRKCARGLPALAGRGMAQSPCCNNMGFSIILCYNILMMEIQRTITILFEDDPDLRETLYRSRELKQAISPIAFNDGKPLGAIALQRKCYHNVKGKLNSQMTISAIRQVSGAYASAKRRKHRISKPFEFRRANA